MIDIRRAEDTDQPAIEILLDKAFGPDRQSKTAYRLRDGVSPLVALGRVAFDDGILRGAIAFWPVKVARSAKADNESVIPALLLGPLVVDPDHQGEGIGVGLMSETLEQARQLGHRLVILVGDLDYYARVGFHNDGTGHLQLPGPVDQDRVLMLSLQGEDFGDLEGDLESAQKIEEQVR
jgi:predicted N-acetyltransferase YhbS